MCPDPIPINGALVPCGKCYECKKRRTQDWIFRLMEEDKVSSSAYFVTLTYSNDTVPQTKNGFLTLRKKDLTDYFNRLKTHDKRSMRDYHEELPPGSPVRYFAVGEYGSKTERPHYHAIIYNIWDVDNIYKAWGRYNRLNNRYDYIGDVKISGVGYQSIGYTAKYIMKEGLIPKFKKDDRVPEFNIQSNGLGKSYLTRETRMWHQADLTRNYVVLPGGTKFALPRYYRDKIYLNHQKEVQRNYIEMEVRPELEAKERLDVSRKYPNMDYETFKAKQIADNKIKLQNEKKRRK